MKNYQRSLGTTVFIATLLLSACGRRPPVQPPPLPVVQAKTALEGKWATGCMKNVSSTGGISREITVEGHVLALVRSEFIDDECKNGKTVTQEFYSAIRVTPLQDAFMTHRVEYINPSGTVDSSWLLRLSPDQRNFLSARPEYLVTRLNNHLNQIYYRR